MADEDNTVCSNMVDEDNAEFASQLSDGGGESVNCTLSCEELNAIWVGFTMELDKMEFTKEQRELMRHAFSKYDKKETGTIKPKYLIKVLRKLGQNPTEDELYSYIDILCANGQTVLSFADVVKVMAFVSRDVDEVIMQAFKVFDTDGSGALSRDEFQAQIRKCGCADVLQEKELDEIMMEADKNGDGEIDLMEFAAMLRSVNKE